MELQSIEEIFQPIHQNASLDEQSKAFKQAFQTLMQPYLNYLKDRQKIYQKYLDASEKVMDGDVSAIGQFYPCREAYNALEQDAVALKEYYTNLDPAIGSMIDTSFEKIDTSAHELNDKF